MKFLQIALAFLALSSMGAAWASPGPWDTKNTLEEVTYDAFRTYKLGFDDLDGHVMCEKLPFEYDHNLKHAISQLQAHPSFYDLKINGQFLYVFPRNKELRYAFLDKTISLDVSKMTVRDLVKNIGDQVGVPMAFWAISNGSRDAVITLKAKSITVREAFDFIVLHDCCTTWAITHFSSTPQDVVIEF